MPLPINFHSIKKFCLHCDAQLKLTITRDIERKKFCSHSCQYKYLQNKYNLIPPRLTKESAKKIGVTLSKRMALGLIPKPPRATAESSRMSGLKRRGKNNCNWIEDRSKLKKRRYYSKARDIMCTWRKDIFERDNFICQKTKIKGGKLIAHHIFNWADSPEKRYDLGNGITLSLESHKTYHKIYGYRNNTMEQLNEFLSRGGGI